MTMCKQLAKSYAEFVCDLLDEKQVTVIKEHLQECPICIREVKSLRQLLSMAEEAGEVPIPSMILDSIEMKVYKRLAAEFPRPEQGHFLSRFFALFPFPGMKNRSPWVLRGAITTFVLAIGIPIAMISLDRDRPFDVTVNPIPVQPPHERIERYRQREIQLSRDEALESKHLKGNDRFATIQLRMVEMQTP